MPLTEHIGELIALVEVVMLAYLRNSLQLKQAELELLRARHRYVNEDQVRQSAAKYTRSRLPPYARPSEGTALRLVARPPEPEDDYTEPNLVRPRVPGDSDE